MTTAIAPDGAAILHETRNFMARFVAFPSPAALDLSVLWAAHTWCVGTDDKLLFDSTPRLAYLSDLPASGKSRALEVTCALSRKAAPIADVTGPALHQLVAAGATLAVDELDLVLGAGDGSKPVRAVINSGYRRSGQVARNKGLASTYAPCMLAGLRAVFDRNPLLAATRSRAVIVEMAPNQGKITLDRWRERIHLPAAAALGATIGAWAVSATVALVSTFPDMPDDCEDRLTDLWEPMFILAAVAGGDWPARALAAFAELGASTASSEPAVPPGMRLLADIRAVWPASVTRLSTAALVSLIMSAPDSVWPSAWRDAAAIPGEMAALLRPYGIGPRKLRVSPGASPVQGYFRSDIVPAVPAVPADGAGVATTGKATP